MNENTQPSHRTDKRFATAEHPIRFLTPAFLGDAEQQGRWRTPPIKALLRQWWRVVWAAEHGFPTDVQRMRHEEGVLFGHAWPEGDRDADGARVQGRKSAVRIRLKAPEPDQPAWTEGHQNGVAPMPDVIGTSYAWFGLLDQRTKQALRTAIKPEAPEGRRTLRLAWPATETGHMNTVLQMLGSFGQLGYRSRGGWGALHVEGVDPLTSEELDRYSRPLEDCLAGEWPAALASDAEGLMLWRGRQTFDHWAKLMSVVAGLRKVVRDPLKTLSGGDLRAVLGSAKAGDRIANPLRWRPVLEPDGQLRLRVFAMPWRVTGELRSSAVSEAQLASAWHTVARTLDQHGDLERSAHW